MPKATNGLSRRAVLAAALPAMAVKMARAQNAAQDATPDKTPGNSQGPEDYPSHQVTFVVPFAPAGDVYKRQCGACLMTVASSRSSMCARADRRSAIGSACPIAVSYTHLDVYKRQAPKR